MSAAEPHQIGITRPRLLNLIGSFLILQAVAWLVLGIYHFFILNFGSTLLNQWLVAKTITLRSMLDELFIQAAAQQVLSTLVESLVLVGVAISGFFTAIGFFNGRRNAWILAVTIQGTSLLLGLIVYFIKKPVHIYLVLLISSLMVAYLSEDEVRAYFKPAANTTGSIQHGNE